MNSKFLNINSKNKTHSWEISKNKYNSKNKNLCE